MRISRITDEFVDVIVGSIVSHIFEQSLPDADNLQVNVVSLKMQMAVFFFIIPHKSTKGMNPISAQHGHSPIGLIVHCHCEGKVAEW